MKKKKFKRSSEQSNAAPSRPEAGELHIDALPLEMLSHVLSFLTLSEQLKLATVSHRWRQAVNICLARCHSFYWDTILGPGHVTNLKLGKILSRLPGLRVLNGIAGEDLDVDILSRRCPQLVEVMLSNFRVTASSLKRLCRRCPKLAVLILPVSCGDACVEAVLRGLPELRSLELYLSSVKGRCLALLPPSLQRLVVNSAGNKRHAKIDLDGVSRCPALTELDITGLYRWPPASSLVKLLNACPRLERLDANGCAITDDFLKHLPDKTPAMRDLDLSGCADLTEDGLKSLGRLKELRSLDLFDTATTDAVLERLQGAFNLTKLVIGPDLFHSHDFSTEALARLVVSCPSLRLVIPSQMVDGAALVECLLGQLSPDRDVTVEMDDTDIDKIDQDRLPDDGPLHLTMYSSCD